MRRFLVPLFALVALVSAGCSAGGGGFSLEAADDGNTAAEVVPSAATFQALPALLAETTARYEMVMSMSVDMFGEAFDMRMPYAGELDGQRLSMVFDFADIELAGIPEAGLGELGAFRLETVVDPPYTYMNLDGLEAMSPFGEGWVRYDITQAAGFDADMFGMAGGSTDPFGSMGLLAGADDVETVGTETVRGVEATHYRVQINPFEAWTSLDDADRARLESALGPMSAEMAEIVVPYDVWLDENDRPVRVTFAIDESTFGDLNQLDGQFEADGAFTMTMTTEIFDYDDPSITVEVPADARDITAEFGSFIED